MSDEEIVHESSEKRSRRGLASYFDRIARAFRRGEPAPADEAQTVTVEVPDDPALDVEVEREDGEVHFTVEVSFEEEEGEVETEVQASKATFEVYEDAGEQWRWRLRHRNGNIIADGAEGYASKQKAEQGLESVKRNVAGAALIDKTKDDAEVEAETGGSKATFELYRDDGDNPRWRLVHDNGNIIADSSQGYSSKQKAKQGLRSVRLNAGGAPIEEVDE